MGSGLTRWPLTAHMRDAQYPVRAFAFDLIDVLSRYEGNMVAAIDEAAPLVERFLANPELTEFGVKREGNHTPGSLWMYYDYDLEIHLSTFWPGVALPIHNHGTWEFLAPAGGEFGYTSYRRIDDGSVPGQSELEVVDERVLRPGDSAVCELPPNDIHSFTPMSADCLLLAMNHGPLAPQRRYFDAATGTYTERRSTAWRFDQAGDHGPRA